jgi:hypothetical protein
MKTIGVPLRQPVLTAAIAKMRLAFQLQEELPNHGTFRPTAEGLQPAATTRRAGSNWRILGSPYLLFSQ